MVDSKAESTISLLVVDDSLVLRRLLRRVFEGLPFVRLVGDVADGRTAVERIQELKPDVVTLDVEMPGLDGLGVLRELSERGLEAGVIMLSAFTRSGADATVEAMRLGAFDFIAKPEGLGGPDASVEYLRRELAVRVRQCYAFQRGRKHRPGPQGGPLRPAPHPAAASAAPKATAAETATASASATQPSATVPGRLLVPGAPFELVAIGSSTGGPHALEVVLGALGKSFPLPILIVQHMPKGFTASLAVSLMRSSGLDVREAVEGDLLAPGRVLVAPGGSHMKYSRGSKGPCVVLSDTPPEHGCRPSVDTLFRSLSMQLIDPCLAVVLTGMGSDGLLGCRLLKRKGAVLLTQDEATSVVYGMPRGPAEEGLSDAVLPLDVIGKSIVEVVGARRGK